MLVLRVLAVFGLNASLVQNLHGHVQKLQGHVTHKKDMFGRQRKNQEGQQPIGTRWQTSTSSNVVS